MKEAVERKDWPEELDKVTEDNYPREEEVDEKEPTRLSHLDKVNSIGATGVERRLGKVVGGGGTKPPIKHPRINYWADFLPLRSFVFICCTVIPGVHSGGFLSRLC